MTKIDGLKNELTTMRNLEALTNMLQQTAARSISQMRESILDSRPFFSEVWRIYGILKQLTPPSPEVVHKHLVVGIGVDWGMPGNLLHRLVAETERIQKEHEADLLIAGKMAHGHFRTKTQQTVHFFSSPKDPTLADIQPIYKVVASYAKVTIVYPQFESLSRQPIKTASFSLSDPSASLEEQNGDTSSAQSKHDSITAQRFIIDPNPQEISNYLNEAVVGLTVHHYFAESSLAYNAAQMVAMRNSHDNAKQESKRLLLRYNSARRALIDSKIRELYGTRIALKAKKRETE
jgi:ATP synthase F1 gamma subunit